MISLDPWLKFIQSLQHPLVIAVSIFKSSELSVSTAACQVNGCKELMHSLRIGGIRKFTPEVITNLSTLDELGYFRRERFSRTS